MQNIFVKSILESDEFVQKTTTERNFDSFPYEPHSIQLAFMKALYGAFEERKIGLFESPQVDRIHRRLTAIPSQTLERL